ncbi:MAG: hypothetical protein IPL53_01850 [Ignavibacteria bacterium]|nr:hypothetical protein [Ignavibacteria bacterium]
MNKPVRLKQAAEYSKKRIKSKNVSLENYITIDNILQNKAGITYAVNLPPQGNTMPAYYSENILVGNIRLT